MKKIKLFFISLWKQYKNLILMLIVAVVSFIINLIVSVVQESLSIDCIIVSIVFAIGAILIIISIIYSFYKKSSKENIFPRIQLLLRDMLTKEKSKKKQFGADSITTDKKLAEIEKNIECEEIWVISNDLSTEIEGGLYADIVSHNLARGIKYKFFVANSPLVPMRIEQLKEKHYKIAAENAKNIEYYILKNDFFFIVTGLDFTIYDPYKNAASGRRGYIGFDLPNMEDLEVVRVQDTLVEAIASKLLVSYIKVEESSHG